MKEIPLTQGKVAIVDDADYEFLLTWKWTYHKYLGLFENVEDAARAYDSKAKELFGEFARTNF